MRENISDILFSLEIVLLYESEQNGQSKRALSATLWMIISANISGQYLLTVAAGLDCITPFAIVLFNSECMA